MRMLFTIRQNCMLNGMHYLIYRLFFTARDLIECHMANRTRSANVERSTQIVFGNMIDMGDHMHGHPGMNGAHIPCFNGAILLLKTSHRLKGTCGSKGQNTQHQEQQKPEKPYLCAFTRRIQLLLTLSHDHFFQLVNQYVDHDNLVARISHKSKTEQNVGLF